jgi:uncharacterized YccA/Bax inhibitor family protein
MALLVFASAMWSWANPSTMWIMVGGIGGFVAALITIFKPTAAPISAPIYAVLEGLFLGGISFLISSQYGQGGIVMQAITLTIGVLFLMLFLYSSGIIKVTDKLRMGIVAATGAIALMYLVNFVMSFFGAAFFTLADTSMMAIGINLVIVGVAAFNLLLDFDFIDRAAASRAPKSMEWYGAFGLMVTLVWLYIELLKLLSRLNRD